MAWFNKIVIAAKKTLIPLFLSLFSIFAPIKPLLLVTGVLIALDTITGIMASLKKGESISSQKFGDVVSKIIRYHIAILSGFLVEKYLIDGLVPISKIAAGYVGITELISLLENMDTLSNKPLFSELIQKLLNKKNDL